MSSTVSVIWEACLVIKVAASSELPDGDGKAGGVCAGVWFDGGEGVGVTGVAGGSDGKVAGNGDGLLAGEPDAIDCSSVFPAGWLLLASAHDPPISGIKVTALNNKQFSNQSFFLLFGFIEGYLPVQVILLIIFQIHRFTISR